MVPRLPRDVGMAPTPGWEQADELRLSEI